MRMALCWPSLILLIFGFLIHANAVASNSNYVLTPELTNFIPTCAQECFVSFLNSNFPAGTCSTKTTLDCLCSTNSTSGYTIGEGAVQCIISEINIGFCQGNYAKDSIVNSAYGMCTGQTSALPNTHATITATLILQTSMPSIVLVAPASTRSSISGQSSSAASSTSTKASSSSLVTATSRPVPSSSASSTVSSIPVASETSSPKPILTKNQIVGITVASIGGGAVAVGLLILFICCRRRKKRARESDLIPFQLEPNHVMDQKKYKYKSFKGPTERGPGGTKNGVAAKIPPRIPPRLDTSSPNMFSRRSIRPDTIGLAISPEQAVSTEKQQRRSSKLLPEKPTLTLKVPKQAEKPINGLSFNQSTLHPSVISRQSTATQFEEDYDESADTGVAADDSWTAKSTNQILDAGTESWQTIRKVDPGLGKSSQVYHWRPTNNVANQGTNNVMSNPDYDIRPLSVAGRKIGSFSQPRVPNAYPRQQDQQLSIPEQNRPITASSSLYSTRGSVSSNDQGRNSNSRPERFSYQQNGPYDNQDPIMSPQKRDQEPKTAGTDFALSPVVESPASGKSPVSYPKIPPPGAGGTRRLSQNTIRMVPPPPQPDFTKALGAGKPWRQAEIAAQVERERAARVQAQQQAHSQEQGQMGMHSLHRQESQRLRGAHENNPTTPSPVSFAFPAPPPQALIPGRSQTTSPPAIQSPYLFRTPSQSKLVPPALLRSRSQLQNEARTPSPSQNQSGIVSQQEQLQTVAESQPTTRMAPTPPPGLLRSRSQLTREARTPSPNLSQSQQSFVRSQQQTQNLQSITESPPSRKNISPPPLLRSRSPLQRQARTLPPLQTQLSQPAQPQPQSVNPHPQSATTTSYRPFPGTSNPNPLSSHPSITFTRSSSLVSQNSQLTAASGSTSSSLLAKRRGTEKASTLTLKNEEDRKKQIAKWRVLKREEIELAKKEGWRPMLGREGVENGGAGSEGNGGWLSPREYEFERTELPTTPGWVPKLTPTRRGDELFLSVQ